MLKSVLGSKSDDSMIDDLVSTLIDRPLDTIEELTSFYSELEECQKYKKVVSESGQFFYYSFFNILLLTQL